MNSAEFPRRQQAKYLCDGITSNKIKYLGISDFVIHRLTAKSLAAASRAHRVVYMRKRPGMPALESSGENPAYGNVHGTGKFPGQTGKGNREDSSPCQ
jgi:hypothetical protein